MNTEMTQPTQLPLHPADLMEQIADRFGDRPALICGDARCNWTQFEQRAAQVATVLLAAGVGPGAKVALYLQNRNEWFEALFAILKIGATPLALSQRHKAEGLVDVLTRTEISAVVYQATFASRLWEVQDQLGAVKCFLQVDDGLSTVKVTGAKDYQRALAAAEPAPRTIRVLDAPFLSMTSGTTAAAAIHAHTQGELCAGLLMLAGSIDPTRVLPSSKTVASWVEALADIEAPPVALTATPLADVGGWWLSAATALFLGGCVVTSPRRAFEPYVLWDLVQQHRVTDLVLAGETMTGPLARALAPMQQDDPDVARSLRRIHSSSSWWRVGSKRRLLAALDCELLDHWLSPEGYVGCQRLPRGSADAEVSIEAIAAARFEYATPQVAEQAESSGNGAVVVVEPGLLQPRWPAAARPLATPDQARITGERSFEVVAAVGETQVAVAGQVHLGPLTARLQALPMVLDALIVAHEGQLVGLVAVDEDDEPTVEEVLTALQSASAPQAEELALTALVLLPNLRRSATGKPDLAWAHQVAARRLAS